MWKSCAVRKATPARRYSAAEQNQREKAYDDGVSAVERELKRTRRTMGERQSAQNRIIAAFGQFATLALGLEGEAVQLITNDFVPVGTELARWAQRFDPGLKKAEIVQASRNAWTACGLQPLLGEPIRLTPSILAYSLMYPYTDNYIDCKDVAAEAKSRFSERFRDRLRGQGPQPQDQREAALWALVGLVEDEYPRRSYPLVFDSLLAIHAAQERSISQLKNGGLSSDAEVLKITCTKGGTSVLADACLARGTLSEAESRFSFDWGVLLQLGDDLQDLREDLRRDSATLFTRAARRGELLDDLVRQLFVFCERVAAGMDDRPASTATLRALLKVSWRSLIVEAMADQGEFFSAQFLSEVELTSPFRLKFLHTRHQRLTKRKGMYASLFDALLETQDKEEHRLPLPNYRCAPYATSPM